MNKDEKLTQLRNRAASNLLNFSFQVKYGIDHVNIETAKNIIDDIVEIACIKTQSNKQE